MGQRGSSVRWSEVVDDEKDHAVSVVCGEPTAIRKVTLMGPAAVANLSGGTAKVMSSHAATQNWTTKIWRLDEGSTKKVAKLGGKPHIVFHVSVGSLSSM
jgi:hypothetical protein